MRDKPSSILRNKMFERLVRLQTRIEAAEAVIYWARMGSSYSRREAGGPTSEQLTLLADLISLRADLCLAAGVSVDLSEEIVMEASYRASV